MAQDVIDGEADTGESAEGSSPSESMVPLSALTAERHGRQALAVEVAELKGRLDGISQAKPQQREFTRAELQGQVDDGRMTPDESDRILGAQLEKKIEERISKKLETSRQATDTVTRIQSEVSKYTDTRPEILQDGTDDRELVAAEYNRQVRELGKPENLETELSALMAVYGPANRLQGAKPKIRETHQDVGGDGGDEVNDDKAPKLPRNVKDHYEKMISQGMYKGWDDVNLKSEIDQKGYGARWK